MLGAPQKKLAPTIHIAGTNGKGSTLACIEASLLAAGFSTQAYLSPHLCSFNERIRFNGKPIESERLAEYLQRASTANSQNEITFFEITTAAAFLAFAEHKTDFLILETGLGGRLDATNLVETTCAAVLTPIDYDHAQFLGNDLATITNEKVAISKRGAVLVSAQQECIEVITTHARELGIPLYLEGQDFIRKPNRHIGAESLSISLRGKLQAPKGAITKATQKEEEVKEAEEEINFPAPSALGEHQAVNATLAAVTLLALHAEERINCSRGRLLEGLSTGISSFSQPARLELLSPTVISSTLVPLDKNWEVRLDGAHNPHAARAVAKALHEHWCGQKYCLIIAMLKGKDACAFTLPFANSIARGFAYGGSGEENDFFAAHALAEQASKANLELQPISSLTQACTILMEDKDLPRRLLIIGSLYLAGEILSLSCASAGISLQERQKRLVYRACHRGMRELDITFGEWVKKLAANKHLNTVLLNQLERLLERTEPELLALLRGSEKPLNEEEANLMQELETFMRNAKK